MTTRTVKEKRCSRYWKTHWESFRTMRHACTYRIDAQISYLTKNGNEQHRGQIRSDEVSEDYIGITRAWIKDWTAQTHTNRCTSFRTNKSPMEFPVEWPRTSDWLISSWPLVRSAERRGSKVFWLEWSSFTYPHTSTGDEKFIRRQWLRSEATLINSNPHRKAYKSPSISKPAQSTITNLRAKPILHSQSSRDTSTKVHYSAVIACVVWTSRWCEKRANAAFFSFQHIESGKQTCPSFLHPHAKQTADRQKKSFLIRFTRRNTTNTTHCAGEQKMSATYFVLTV